MYVYLKNINKNSFFSPSTSKIRKLLFETHVMIPKDAPPVVSIVLVNARVLLLLEWLDRLRNFVLSTADFSVPKQTSSGIIY
jgi:hypothetical protein